MVYLVKIEEEFYLITENNNLVYYDDFQDLVITGKRKTNETIKPFTDTISQNLINKIDTAIGILKLEIPITQIKVDTNKDLIILGKLMIRSELSSKDHKYIISDHSISEGKENIKMSPEKLDTFLSLIGKQTREEHIKFLTSIKEELIKYVV